MNNVICLLGPNAIGKTTAVRRWCEKYGDKLVGVLADTQISIINGEEIRDKGWQSGDVEERERLAAKYEAMNRVVVVEAAAGYGVRVSKAFKNPVCICVVCSGKASRANIESRCVAKGKEFRGDFWTADKCSYDSERRHVTHCKKSNLESVIVRVENRETDWEKADEEFSKLFMKIHNSLRRSRS